MSLRVCSQPGCPTLTDTAGRCPVHAKAADKARGTRQVRGYDKTHERERARWKRRLDRDPYPCARCGEPILIGDAWDLGHTDDRTAWTGPEHIACNRAAGARKGNAQRA